MTSKQSGRVRPHCVLSDRARQKPGLGSMHSTQSRMKGSGRSVSVVTELHHVSPDRQEGCVHNEEGEAF